MTLRILREGRLPTLTEQRDNILRWFGTEAEIGPATPLNYETLGATIGASSSGAFELLVQSMVEHGYLDIPSADLPGCFSIAFHGLERLEALQQATPSGYNAFMAMKFGDPVLDRIVDKFFRPSVNETGFQLYRLDDKPEAGLIDARLRNEIRNCRFLVADLSHANLGVYWEAGYAEGLGKPVIYTCERSVFDGKRKKITRPHFDTNHHLTVLWEESNPKAAADRLKETIRFTIPESRQAANTI